MTEVFVDTSFDIALLLGADSSHRIANDLAAEAIGPLVTTTGVPAELGNFLAATPGRGHFIALVNDPSVSIVDLDSALFEKALGLYAARPDKFWSLVDCASFIVMADRGATNALTTDHHFEQAGFKVLLR